MIFRIYIKFVLSKNLSGRKISISILQSLNTDEKFLKSEFEFKNPLIISYLYSQTLKLTSMRIFM